MFAWLFGRSLEDKLHETRTVRVHGVKFKIRKINPLDYMAGTKALRQIYQTMQVTTASQVEMQNNQLHQVKAHYADVILAGVVDPPLKRAADTQGVGIPIENLLTDWEFASELYQRIFEYTYGKKKLNRSWFPKSDASKSTP